MFRGLLSNNVMFLLSDHKIQSPSSVLTFSIYNPKICPQGNPRFDAIKLPQPASEFSITRWGYFWLCHARNLPNIPFTVHLLDYSLSCLFGSNSITVCQRLGLTEHHKRVIRTPLHSCKVPRIRMPRARFYA